MLLLRLLIIGVIFLLNYCYYIIMTLSDNLSTSPLLDINSRCNVRSRYSNDRGSAQHKRVRDRLAGPESE